MRSRALWGSVCDLLGVRSAVCLPDASDSLPQSHDWGSVACYEAARRRPDVFSAVIGVTIPVSRMMNATPESMFLSLQVPSLFEPLPTHRIHLGADTHAFVPSLFRTKHV